LTASRRWGLEHVLDSIGIYKLSRGIVRRHGFDLRDTDVIAVTISLSDGLLFGNLVCPEIGDLS